LFLAAANQFSELLGLFANGGWCGGWCAFFGQDKNPYG
jgi:hypothetical protein